MFCSILVYKTQDLRFIFEFIPQVRWLFEGRLRFSALVLKFVLNLIYDFQVQVCIVEFNRSSFLSFFYIFPHNQLFSILIILFFLWVYFQIFSFNFLMFLVNLLINCIVFVDLLFFLWGYLSLHLYLLKGTMPDSLNYFYFFQLEVLHYFYEFENFLNFPHLIGIIILVRISWILFH